MSEVEHRATWSSIELVWAALCLPGIVGWSGTVDSHPSRPALNWSTVPVSMSLSPLGRRLNNLPPWIERLASLALLTGAGAEELYGGITTNLPLLGF